nr:spore cortex biosynthesis protein YabQ [Solibacillus sp. MA9]
MFISGIAVGMVIDGTRIITRQFPIKFIRDIARYLEALVWVLLAISTFYLLFLIKGGQWRFVDPLAQILGIISYELFFQNIARFIGRLFVNIVIKPIYFIGHVFVVIIRKIIQFVIALCLLIINPIFKFLKKYLLKNFKSKK